MKKVLFATTALVATSGFAMAEIDVSGYIEAGIVGGDGGSGYAAGETQFLQHWSVSFSGSSTTDSGLTFGFNGEIDDSSDQNAGGRGGNAAVRLDSERAFISGSWGTLTLGDTDGAFDWAMQEVGYGTSIADDHTSHAGFSGNGGLDGAHDDQVLRYNHSVGDFGFAASVELDDSGIHDATVGVGITYDMALGGVDLGIGLGYQSGQAGGSAATTISVGAGADGLDGTADDVTSLVAAVAPTDVDVMGVSLDFAFAGGFGARVNYSTLDASGGDIDHTGIGVSYSSGPLLVEANWGEFDAGAAGSSDGWGVAVNYDLGGGAVAMFGYGDGDADESWSLGLGMSF
jgi:outer membrane protein OmpU